MRATHLRTEYLKDPIGIDILTPRLQWWCEGGLKQRAYEVRCVKVEADGTKGEVLWESGKRFSQAMHADYAGLPLESRTRVCWQVTLWDENDQPGEPSEAFFEMGLLHPEDWKASWITGDYKVDPKKRYPVDCFRKTFTASAVDKARLYITACGLYEARLNGKKAGDFVLAPGITDYNKRIQYQTIDVTDLLKEGENVLEVELADGWYRGSTGAWGLKNQYGTETALLAQLEVVTREGKTERVLSDGSWEWSSDGPIRFADNKDGEIVEARRKPTYAGTARKTVRKIVPTASNNVPVKEMECLEAVMSTAPSGKTLLDFGQNIAGIISFRIEAREGQVLKLRFGEMLDDNGELSLKNIQCVSKNTVTPLQQVIYTCREGVNEYKTKFAIFGFQYVEIEFDEPLSLKAEDFTAIAVYSAMEETLEFDCSNELLNRFFSCTYWSAKNNSADLPTDCPTRERHGWTGDAQIFAGTASYLFDYASFGKKFLNDMYDWQDKKGRFPQIAPAGGVNFYMDTMNGSVGWADAGVIIPWVLYRQYGDLRILRDYYPGMKRYARFMMSRCGRNGLMAKPLGLSGEAARYAVNTGQSYGEWLEPADVHPNHWSDTVAPHPEVSTAYTAYVMGLMEQIAEKLHKKKDAAIFRKYHEGCRKAYQAMVEKPEFSLDTDRQALLVRPLYMGLLNEEQTEFAENRLLSAVRHYNYRVGTGFLSTPLLPVVLGDLDLDAAYRVLENEEMPGWLFMPKAGATTVWENWEGIVDKSNVASLDHYSKGAVLEWVFRTVSGINVDGPNRFIIAPRPGGTLTYASCTYQSIYGPVSVRWRREAGKAAYTITIPSGTTAQVKLPGREAVTLSAGTYDL